MSKGCDALNAVCDLMGEGTSFKREAGKLQVKLDTCSAELKNHVKDLSAAVEEYNWTTVTEALLSIEAMIKRIDTKDNQHEQ
jgi:hypothetical protein